MSRLLHTVWVCGSILACTPEPAAPPPRLMQTGPVAPTPAPAPASPDAQAAPTADDRVRAHFEQRQQLDRTVWKHEVAAQAHERIVVELWDALRGGEPPDAVLAALPFESIALAPLDPPTPLAPGLVRRAATKAPATLDRAGWTAWLDARRAEGVELVHSEWHHARFEPATAARAARSRFTAELHALRAGMRWRVKLRFTVEWAPATVATADGPRHVPRRIVVDDIDAVGQPDPPRFTRMQRLPLGPHRPQTLIAADLDGDGRTELLAPLSNRRFDLEGERFVERPFIPGQWPGATAAVLADLTGDGQLDVLSTASKDGRTVLALYRGAADGAFVGGPEVVFDPQPPIRNIRVLTVGDIDGDGDLDVFAPQYRGAYNGGRMPTPFDDADDSWPAWLLRNDGGRLTDITAASGLSPRRRHTQSASFFDADDDGDLDLLTVNDFAGVELHRNDGAGRFTRDTAAFDNPTLFGMSHALGDFDRDGALDLFATGMNSTTVRRLNALDAQRPDKAAYTRRRTEMTYGNRLYLGRPGGFALAPFAPEVQAAGWAWGVVAFDAENDGDLDLFAANGFMSGRTALDYCTRYWSHDVYLDDGVPAEAAAPIIDRLAEGIESGISWNGFEHNKLFERTAAGFVEVGFPRGLGGEADARNVIADDLDGDGRVDLVIAEAARGGLWARVMRNTAPAGRWIAVDLAAAPGQSPWGASITLKTSAGARRAVAVTGDSFAAQHRPRAHFGLAPDEAVEAIEIRWPGGRVDRLDRPAPGRSHRVSPAR